MKSQQELFEVRNDCLFSPDRVYRYTLHRRWGEGDRAVQFIGLNPSTADEVANDPTVRRCINYARAWGFDRMVMTNLFAFRATDPKVMKAFSRPVGGNNDKILFDAAKQSAMTVCCWGTHGKHLIRDYAVKFLLRRFDVHYLKLTKDGHPQHPLYLRKDLEPTIWWKGMPDGPSTKETSLGNMGRVSEIKRDYLEAALLEADRAIPSPVTAEAIDRLLRENDGNPN